MSEENKKQIEHLARSILIASVENSGISTGVYANGKSVMLDRVELSIKIAKAFYSAIERGE